MGYGTDSDGGRALCREYRKYLPTTKVSIPAAACLKCPPSDQISTVMANRSIRKGAGIDRPMTASGQKADILIASADVRFDTEADMQTKPLLKELTRRFKPRYTRSSKRDSNPRNLERQVVAVTLDLPELY
jgi:hypothetical protein